MRCYLDYILLSFRTMSQRIATLIVRKKLASSAPSLPPSPPAAHFKTPPTMAADIAGDAETSPPLPVLDDLDDDGFPVFSPAAATSSFADDFYRSGTDWSSLRAPPPHQPEAVSGKKAKGGGLLVQRSLFQVWGIEKPLREEAAQGVRAGAGASSSSPSPFGAWSGRKRRWGGSEEEGAVRKPLACPFYKKIPGNGRSFSRLSRSGSI